MAMVASSQRSRIPQDDEGQGLGRGPPSAGANDLSHLPESLLLEILARLPVESMFRFKCVCKNWRTLISDPSFACLYISQRFNSSLPVRILYRLVSRVNEDHILISYKAVQIEWLYFLNLETLRRMVIGLSTISFTLRGPASSSEAVVLFVSTVNSIGLFTKMHCQGKLRYFELAPEDLEKMQPTGAPLPSFLGSIHWIKFLLSDLKSLEYKSPQAK
ncbi:hypothetical protein LguiA_018557 [Lonicera macranthoides]